MAAKNTIICFIAGEDVGEDCEVGAVENEWTVGTEKRFLLSIRQRA